MDNWGNQLLSTARIVMDILSIELGLGKE